jgi:hypothetical protein
MDLPPLTLGDRSGVGPLASFAAEDHVAYFEPGAPFLSMQWRFSIGHVLRPLDANRTRILQMSRAQRVSGSPLLGGVALLLNDVMETIMGVTQLKNLRRVIESYPARLQSGDIHRVPGKHGHQRADYSFVGEPKAS